jgi:phosphotransferase system  glucose/maltose/N-acetylglucosamine-specific IIC component
MSCGVGGGHVLLCVWCGFVIFLFYFFIFILVMSCDKLKSA